MEKYVYDIECYPNCFMMVIINASDMSWLWYKITPRHSDLDDIYKFFVNRKMLLITFNGNHYDNVLLHYIVKNYHRLKSEHNTRVVSKLKKISDTIIQDENWYPKLKQYKYPPRNLPYKSVDVYLYWSKLIRMRKKISLKSLEVANRAKKVQDLPYRHTKFIEPDEVFDLRDYCYNDTYETYRVAKRLWDKVKTRRQLEVILNVRNLTSIDDVKLGATILGQRYLNRVDYDMSVLKDLRTDYGDRKIEIAEILLPYLNFKTKPFQEALRKYQNARIQQFEGFAFTATLNNTVYSLGVGGLHSDDPATITKPDEDELYMACDVTSYYPNLVIRHKIKPAHLEDVFINVYEGLYDDRVKAKRIAKNPTYPKGPEKTKAITENDTFKLALNGATGNMKSPYSWLFDPRANLKIVINGQLGLCMLAEDFELNGIRVVSANTDGLEVIVKKKDIDKYYEICQNWERVTKMPLEHDEYKVVVRKNVNHYLAVFDDGKVKQKGLFKTDPPLEDAHAFLAIPKAIEAHFKEGVRIEDHIMQNNDIYDFCDAKRMAPKFYTELGGKALHGKINRVFISTQGKTMMKVNQHTGAKEALFKGYKMELMNVYDPDAINRVDKKKYISKVYKLLGEFTVTNLFD